MHELHRPCRLFPNSVYHLINYEQAETVHGPFAFEFLTKAQAWYCCTAR